ncbi:pentapeptide repeat-containing protein [Flavobacterium sp. NG2]|uniref:pentapeptide repeat-containing protein n=1 Tax=Flavobacterium sp. NG2 TaxID=3097547 RepID=UPI002A810AE7|nr:pentapeptide repeat-containing protein [Flavobacterium sp. NG2]WPR70962.1 pentapeptide repeat-containing protein [Flavobacterium sp. NG2]
MEELLHIQKTFEKVAFINKSVHNREFEDCIFKNCDFSNSDFSNNTFMDCQFIDCNLSMTKLIKTGLKTVTFTNCKLMGIEFHACNDFLFQVSFQDSVLDYASFTHKKMPKTTFSNCSLKEVAFMNTDLSLSVFDNCNLAGAIFNNTQLKEVNFTTAYNYNIDPEFNPMKKARFASDGILGLLRKYDIKIV